MANLLKDTMKVMKEHNKTIDDIDFINARGDLWKDNIEAGCYDWAWFLVYSQKFKNYDDGFGGAEVDDIEIVFKDGSWIERGEYDGSEWWDFKKTPSRLLK